MPKTNRPFQQVAKDIARDLFTDGEGRRADRLVLKHKFRHKAGEGERDGAGWCEALLADRIEDRLTRAANTAAHGND